MLIALCGKAGAGKDTVGSILQRNYNFHLDAFAKPLKGMLAVVGILEPARDRKELPLPGFDFSYRKAAQLLGTEWGRAVDENLWAKLAGNRYRQSDSMHYAFTDLRFMNEFQMLKANYGCVVKVVGRQNDVTDNASHASEVGIPDHLADYLIVNDGTIEQLADKVEELAATLSIEKYYNQH